MGVKRKGYKDSYVSAEILGSRQECKGAVYLGETIGTFDSVIVDYLMETLKPKKVAEISLSRTSSEPPQIVMGDSSQRQAPVENGMYKKDEKRKLEIFYDPKTNIAVGRLGGPLQLKDETEESLTEALYDTGSFLGIGEYIDLTATTAPMEPDGDLLYATTSDKSKRAFDGAKIKPAGFTVMSNMFSSRKEAALEKGIAYSSLFSNIHMDTKTVQMGSFAVQMQSPKGASKMYAKKAVDALRFLLAVPYDEAAIEKVSKVWDQKVAEANKAIEGFDLSSLGELLGGGQGKGKSRDDGVG